MSIHLLESPDKFWWVSPSSQINQLLVDDLEFYFSSVQFSSVAQLSLTLCNPMNRSTPGLPVHHYLLEFTQTHVHRIGDAIKPSHPLLPLFLLPPIPPNIRVFSNESALHMRWPKHWSFSFSIIPSKEIPGWISFRMDWLDLLAFQGTLKSLLQHHTSKASNDIKRSWRLNQVLECHCSHNPWKEIGSLRRVLIMVV